MFRGGNVVRICFDSALREESNNIRNNGFRDGLFRWCLGRGGWFRFEDGRDWLLVKIGSRSGGFQGFRWGT